mmetsp:Transcript_23197/g.64836  ORF Transcript_23197/g.64836 Transcript_23197/m.64836 type:complete len:222 (+) Transcript_23197:2619-3284(+)
MAFGGRLHAAIWFPFVLLSRSITCTSRSCTMYNMLPLHWANGLSQSSLNTTIPASCPTAIKFDVRCAVMIQKRSLSRRNVWIPVRFVTSQTRIVRSSEFDKINSFLGWNMTHETLLEWPRRVSTSQAFVSFIRHSLIRRSSAPETIKGNVGWKAAQLTPRSWPSRTYFTTASEAPKTSPEPVAEGTLPLTDTVLSRRPEVSQTRTVWSSDADTTRSSFGWK